MPKLVTDSILHASPTYGGIYEFFMQFCIHHSHKIRQQNLTLWNLNMCCWCYGFLKFWYLNDRVLIFKNSTGEVKREPISLTIVEKHFEEHLGFKNLKNLFWIETVFTHLRPKIFAVWELISLLLSYRQNSGVLIILK